MPPPLLFERDCAPYYCQSIPTVPPCQAKSLSGNRGRSARRGESACFPPGARLASRVVPRTFPLRQPRRTSPARPTPCEEPQLMATCCLTACVANRRPPSNGSRRPAYPAPVLRRTATALGLLLVFASSGRSQSGLDLATLKAVKKAT